MYSGLHKTRVTERRLKGDRNATVRRLESDQNQPFFRLKSSLSRRLRDGVFAFTHSGSPLCRYGHIPTYDHSASVRSLLQ